MIGIKITQVNIGSHTAGHFVFFGHSLLLSEQFCLIHATLQALNLKCPQQKNGREIQMTEQHR